MIYRGKLRKNALLTNQLAEALFSEEKPRFLPQTPGQITPWNPHSAVRGSLVCGMVCGDSFARIERSAVSAAAQCDCTAAKTGHRISRPRAREGKSCPRGRIPSGTHWRLTGLA